MSDATWKDWIGRKGEVIQAPFAVTQQMISQYCEFSENANPLYHDADIARDCGYQQVISPPTMLMTATRPVVWSPDGAIAGQYYLSLSIPIDAPRSINLSIKFEFDGVLQIDDLVQRQSTITAITPKTLRLGEGYVIEERIEYSTQRDPALGRMVNTMFRYRSEDLAVSG